MKRRNLPKERGGPANKKRRFKVLAKRPPATVGKGPQNRHRDGYFQEKDPLNQKKFTGFK